MLDHLIRGLLFHYKKNCYFHWLFFGKSIQKHPDSICEKTLEILYRKNLAKLLRISNENKWEQAKGDKYDERKKTVTKKLRVAPPGFEPAPQLPLAQKLRNLSCKINSLKVFLSAIHAV